MVDILIYWAKVLDLLEIYFVGFKYIGWFLNFGLAFLFEWDSLSFQA